MRIPESFGAYRLAPVLKAFHSKFPKLREARRKRLLIVPWSEGAIDVAILMIWYKDKWISLILQAFMEATGKIMKR